MLPRLSAVASSSAPAAETTRMVSPLAVVADRWQQGHVPTVGHLREPLGGPGEDGRLTLLLVVPQRLLEEKAGTTEEGPGLEHLVELVLEREPPLLELGDAMPSARDPRARSRRPGAPARPARELWRASTRARPRASCSSFQPSTSPHSSSVRSRCAFAPRPRERSSSTEASSISRSSKARLPRSSRACSSEEHSSSRTPV